MFKRERIDLSLPSLRPLVRYVDPDQAIVELRIQPPRRSSLQDSLQGSPPGPRPPTDVLIEVKGPDGFNDEQRVTIGPGDEQQTLRFQIIHPRRWWPAGMGEQPLYSLTASLFVDGVPLETRCTTIGLTSVRRSADAPRPGIGRGPTELLVNSEVCPIRSILPVDLIDERRLLPVGGQSLLIVRGHYGPDVLYDSADRTGLLLIQTVPIHPDGEPEIDVAAEVDRLSAHPSLAGWFVGHMGKMRERLAERIRELDPSRNVFLDFPGTTAA
ncbi:MAG: hypothetical protein NTW19_04995 [Planctomycetota bacterium]|nr:hypothetical protein [Planctomycetota bacterium]